MRMVCLFNDLMLTFLKRFGILNNIVQALDLLV